MRTSCSVYGVLTATIGFCLLCSMLGDQPAWGQAKRPTSGDSKEKDKGTERATREIRPPSRPEPRRESRPEPRRDSPQREAPRGMPSRGETERPASSNRMDARGTNSPNGNFGRPAGNVNNGNGERDNRPGAAGPDRPNFGDGGNAAGQVEFGASDVQLKVWEAWKEQMAAERAKERELREAEDRAREEEEKTLRAKQESEAQTLAVLAAEVARLRAARDARADALERDLERRKREQRDEQDKFRDKQRRQKERRDDWDRRMARVGQGPMPAAAKPKPAAAKNPPAKPDAPPPRKPLDEQELADALDDLASGDIGRETKALGALARALVDGDPRKVIQAILPHLDPGNKVKRQLAARALANWATAEVVPSLIELLGEDDKATRIAVIKALGELRDPRAIAPLAARLGEPDDRAAAVKALTAFGGDAEKAWRKQLSHEDIWVRAAAIDALTEIGGPDNAALLKDIAEKDENGFVQRKAGEAVKQIGGRAAQ